MTDILIIGAGPAGMTAAIYGRRYGFSVKVFEKLSPGGQLGTTPEVENYPGIKSIGGFELALQMKEQAAALGAEFTSEAVTGIKTDGEKAVITAKDEESCRAIIIATGGKRRKLGCEGEEEFAGRGVSYCATCDGAFFKNKDVVIVGGGNTALEDALFLSNGCSRVYLIHRRDEMRGMKSLVKAVEENPKIEILYSSRLKAIRGDKKVELAVAETKSGIRELSVSGVFIAVGTEPDNEFLRGEIALNESGLIIAGEDCSTDKKGVYAAGDCRIKPLRQIVTAASDGAVAAFEAANYINTL